MQYGSHIWVSTAVATAAYAVIQAEGLPNDIMPFTDINQSRTYRHAISSVSTSVSTLSTLTVIASPLQSRWGYTTFTQHFHPAHFLPLLFKLPAT